MHPEYNAATQDNDITVLKMSEPITFSPNVQNRTEMNKLIVDFGFNIFPLTVSLQIQPICLPFKYSGTSLNGFKAIATGM